MSYTKGPWKVQNYILYANHLALPEYPIHAPKRGRIAKAKKYSDACLIAAAPELLEALEEMNHKYLLLGDMSEFPVKIRALISKAKGQS